MHHVWDATLYVALPAFGAAAVLFALVAWPCRAKAAKLGAALALVAGLVTAAWIEFGKGLPASKVLSLIAGLGNAVNRESLDTMKTGLSTSQWLPLVTLAIVIIGLLARAPRVPEELGRLVVAVSAPFAAWILVPKDLAAEHTWLTPVFAATLLAEWVLLEHLSRDWPRVTAIALALIAGASSVVLLYSHTALFATAALMLSGAMGGVVLGAVCRKGDTGGAVPGAVVWLTGLLAAGKFETFSEVPDKGFLLPAFAPLALLPLAVPRLGRLRGAGLAGLVLVAIPAAYAVVLAMQAESLEGLE
jgi:hypothetical protein